MKLVSIGVSRSDGFVGRAIRFVTRGKVNHVFFLVTEGERDMVIGADPNGFCLQSRERFEAGGHTTIVDTFDAEDLGCDLGSGLHFLLDWMDEGYDYLAFLGMPWVLLGRAFGKRWHNPFGSPWRHFCSEAGAELLAAVNCPGAKVLDPGSTNPEDLYDFMRDVRARAQAA